MYVIYSDPMCPNENGFMVSQFSIVGCFLCAEVAFSAQQPQTLGSTLSINEYVTSLVFQPFEQPNTHILCVDSFDLIRVEIVREIVIYMQIMQIVCLFDSSFECFENKMLISANARTDKHTHTANYSFICRTFVTFRRRIYFI